MGSPSYFATGIKSDAVVAAEPQQKFWFLSWYNPGAGDIPKISNIFFEGRCSFVKIWKIGGGRSVPSEAPKALWLIYFLKMAEGTP
jgi:hypothetical protein